MSSQSQRTLAFFGATGGCAGFCLASALNAGYDCTALARTPAKLTASLKSKGVDASTQDSHLTIIQGDIRDVQAVKRTLAPSGTLVDVIMSGIGGVPKLEWSIIRPVGMYDPTICQDAGQTILLAAKEISSTKKPFLINVSTTGIPAPGCPRDVPLLFYPLYRWCLAAPHEDKEVLEHNLREEVKKGGSERGISGFVNVKPSLLMDGDRVGLENVRAGGEKVPAIGYAIRRQDVGEWIFEKLVKSEVPAEWKNSSVAITY